MSNSFNLLNELGERNAHRGLLAMMGHINKRSTALAAGDLCKRKRFHANLQQLFRCYVMLIREWEHQLLTNITVVLLTKP